VKARKRKAFPLVILSLNRCWMLERAKSRVGSAFGVILDLPG